MIFDEFLFRSSISRWQQLKVMSDVLTSLKKELRAELQNSVASHQLNQNLKNLQLLLL